MYAQSLDDDLPSLGALIPDSFIAPVGMSSKTSSPEPQQPTAPPPMPTEVFTPLPGQVKKRCCSDGRATVINLNVNAGNNNGNSNGNGNGNAQGTSAVPANRTNGNAGAQQRTYDDQQESYPAEQVRIVEKPVYKPLYVVREKIKKVLTYRPMQQVYERRVGKVYDDRPMAFEGKPVDSNIIPKSN